MDYPPQHVVLSSLLSRREILNGQGICGGKVPKRDLYRRIHESAGTDQARDALNEPGAKAWKDQVSFYKFSPKLSKRL